MPQRVKERQAWAAGEPTPDGWEAVTPCRSLNRAIANSFVTEVEEMYGSADDTACDLQTKLVEAKLEMVRAAGLFHCGVGIHHFCWLDTCDCL